jgi:hypothetical protein
VRAWNGWHNDPSADPETLANNAIAELQATVKRQERQIESLIEWLVTQHDYDEAVIRSGLADLAKRVEEEDHD